MLDLPVSSKTSTRRARAGDETLLDVVLGRSAALNPFATEVAFTYLYEAQTPGRGITYRELDRRARRLAAQIQSSASPADRVLLVLPPCLDYIVCFFACLYAGVIAVPALPPTNPRMLPRLARIAQDAQPSLALAFAEVCDRISQQAADLGVRGAHDFPWLAIDDLPPSAARWKRPHPSPGDTVFLQYTSGSTGHPKGVMISHENILANARLIHAAFDVQQHDTIVSWLPPHHDMGLIGKIIYPVFAGAHAVHCPPALFLKQPYFWLRTISDYRACISSAPNFAYDLCTRRVTEQQKQGLDLSGWKFALNGAEPIRAQTLRDFAQAFAPCGFRATALTPVYGMAESTLLITAHKQIDDPPTALTREVSRSALGRGQILSPLAEDDAQQFVCVGSPPLPNHHVVIVDPQNGVRLPESAIGEIWLHGPSIAQAYWRQGEETARSFGYRLDDGTGKAYLRTGDLGCLVDGELIVTGRIKEMMIFHGRNVYPQDIEQTVESIDSAFRRDGCAVFSIEDAQGTRLVAVQEIEPRQQAASSGLLARVRAEIAEQHEIVDLEALLLVNGGHLPRTSSGKIQRLRCRDMYLARQFEPLWDSRGSFTKEPEGFAATQARTAHVEATLKSIWTELLDVADLNDQSNFFLLGGQSILVTQLASAIRLRFGVDVPFRVLFESPTLKRMAQAVAGLTAGSTVVQPIERCARNAPLPLSFAQQRLWFLDQLLPNTSQYNIPGAVRLSGQLDLNALSRTLNEIVRRHEALRTTFTRLHGQPVQIIASELNLPLPLEDLSALPPGSRELQLQSRLQEEALRPFDLIQGPLIRAQLVRLAEREHVLALTLHHIVSDGWSMAVLIREFVALYAAFLQGKPSPLPELPIQYADFAHWQRGWLSGAVLEEHLDYWREQLAGAPELLSLPTDRPRPPTITFNGATVSFSLSAQCLAALNALAQSHNATLFMALTAAFQLLLARYSGQNDICLGTPIANRNRAEIEPLIGCFVNTLVLRARINGDQSFEELLDQVRATALGAYAHQDLPFETLVDALNPQRNLNHTPLFQVMFALQNLPFGAVELPGLTSQPLPPPALAAKFDLTLDMSETPEGLLGAFNYNTDLFDPETIERLIGHFSRLLEAIVAHPTRPLAALDILSADEREQLLRGFNDTHRDFPLEQTIPQLFEAQVRRAPQALALLHEDRSLTYAELNERANALAHHLIARGVGPDVLVGLCLERSVDLIVALLATLKAGGAYVPLDPGYPSQRLAFMLQDSRPALLLSHSSLATQLPELDLPCLWLDTQAGLWDELPHTNPTPATLPDHLAYVIYTSGSTGKPKGVMIEQRSLVNHISWQVAQFAFHDRDIFLQRTSPAFDAAGWEIWTPLCLGAPLVLLSTADQHDPQAIFAAVSRYDVTILQLVPSLLGALPQAVTPSDTGSLRYLFCGGEPLSRELLTRAQTLAQEGVVNLYGPTEVTIDATAWCAARHSFGPTVSIGRPIANTTVYLLDPHGQPVPVGVAGELYIGGAGLARGYLNRPDITAERFIPDRFGPAGSRLYRTGDLARWLPEGTLEYLGRIDQQVKIRGFRIELGEIEAALAALPNVREAAVLAREDSPDEKRLVAYLIPHEPESLAAATVREALRQSLPEYMVPAHVVMLDRLPLTPNGKLDRKALPPPDLSASSQTYVAPRTQTERALADLWQEVLAVPQVSIHDNFFELGGHSLLAVKLVDQMRQAGVAIDVRTLFASPTIAAIADRSGQTAVPELTVPPNLIPAGCEAITPEMLPLITLSEHDIRRIAAHVPTGMPNIQDIYPLAPLQEGVLFHHLASQKSDPYLMPATLAFDTRAHLDAFLQALQQVIQRHDILRSAVLWQGLRTPLQVVWREATLPIEQIEMPPEAHVNVELASRFDPRHYRLDVRRAPLLHALVAQDPANSRWLLRLFFHHLVADNTTLAIIIEEIRLLLEGRAQQLPVPLPFRDFVVRARRAASQDEHDAFFRTLLADVTEPTAPFGLLDVRGDGAAIAQARLPIAPHVSDGLRRQARRLGVSSASLVHLAWAQVLARTSGRNDVVFGTVLLGRMQGARGIGRVLGVFINTLPIRLRLDAVSLEQSVRNTHALLTELMHHEHAPLAHAQRCSGVAAPAPLFTALLNYRYGEIDPLQQQAWEGITLLSGEERTNYPITLSVDDMGEGFALTAQVREPLSPQRLCTYLHTALEHLVQALETRPDTPVQDLDILPPHEREQLLCGFNRPIPSLPEDLELPHGLTSDQLTAVRVLAPDRQLSPISALGELHLVDPAGQLFSTGVRARWSPEGDIEYLRSPTEAGNDTEPVVYVAPRTPNERALVDLWQEILEVPQVGIHDNFFRIGGQSLLAVAVLSQIETRLGAALAVETFFQSPTIAQLADALSNGTARQLTPIERARDRDLPLSFAQQRLWFLDQLLPNTSQYNISGAVRLAGQLDLDALGRTLNEIVRRHEALRTTFTKLHGQPVQIIAPELNLPLPVEDLSGLPSNTRESELQRYLHGEALRPFDLSQGPLIRTGLLRLAEREHVLALTLHHIVSDGWSMAVLIREFAALYTAFLQRQPSPLSELPIHYADFAHWQRQWLMGAVLEEHLNYWREQLAGAPELLSLPTDRPRPPTITFNGATISFKLSAQCLATLNALAQSHNATLFMALTAVFQLLLARYSGQDDICIGTPIANRNRAEIEPLIGCFVNTLVLRARVDGRQSFGELLDQVRATALAAYAHQDLPFETLVDALNPQRNLNHTPLFQVMFALQNLPFGARVELPGLTSQLLPPPALAAKFDLTLEMSETPEGLLGALNYNTDLFNSDTIERLIGHFSRLLEAIVAHPAHSLAGLDMLETHEREQLLRTFNGTRRDFPLEQTIPQLFEAQVRRSPEAVAVVHEDRSLTYAELNERANSLAHYLIARGVGPDVVVGICAERSLEMVIGLIGILKAGGAYLPLDPTYPAERLQYMLTDAAPRVLLTQARLREPLPASDAEVIALDEQWGEIAQLPGRDLDTAALGLTSHHLAYVIYTSGSTGKPKGAMNEHRGVVNRLQWMQDQYRLDPQHRVLQKTPFSFDVSVWEFFWTLTSGARLVVARPEGHADPVYLRNLIEGTGVTTLHFVPSMLQSFLDQHRPGECGGLRHIVCSGEELSASLQRKCLECLPRVRLSNLYGPTEAAIDVTAWECSREGQSARVPIGRPISNIQIYVLDRYGQPAPVGVSGEIYIGGVGVGRGYLSRSDLTAERFVPNPFDEPGSRLYRTGDLARWLPEGTVEYLGRIDQQVKIRGFRIELGEIEAALAALPNIREAAVLAREDSPGDEYLVAYLVPHEEPASIEPTQLRNHLRQSLPEYMVPAHFVLLERLPLTPNGKLDRKALPTPDLTASSQTYVAPRNATERALADLWQKVLARPKVGIHDNFFELGGHSLLAVKLVHHMRQADFAVDVRALFASPTIAGLAELAAQAAVPELPVPPNLIPPGCEAITPEMLPLITLSEHDIQRIAAHVPGGMPNIQDIYPLAPLQEGVLFHHLASEEGDLYLLPSQLAFDTRARLDAFLQALQQVIQRHDILRTAVLWQGLPTPLQVVWREAILPIEQIEMPPEVDVNAELARRFDPQRYRLDVRRAPLIGAFVAHDSQRSRWLLRLISHHLTTDHATLAIIIEEIRLLLEGRAEQLPETMPFRDFVVRARRAVSQDEHDAFFRTLLADVTEPTAPFGLLDVRGDGGAVTEARLPVAPHIAHALRRQARRLGVSTASLMHLAWAQVLARTSGRNDVVFGTVLLGRMQVGEGAERVLGMFVNTLPIRLRLDAASVEQGVRNTHALLTELMHHEQAPLAHAQRCSGVAAPAPLFTALLNYRYSEIDPLQQQAWEGITLLSGEERTNYPITLSVDDLGEGFALTAQVREPLSPQRLCAYLHTALEHLVQALETRPDTPVMELDILSADEREQLLRAFNDTHRDFPLEQTIPQLFKAQVRRTPEALAVVHENRSLTYAQLNERANTLAHHLIACGVGPDVLVGLCLERSVDLVMALLAILKAGGAYVPLDPGYPSQRLAFMLQDSRPTLLLSHSALATQLPELDIPCLWLDTQAGLWDELPHTNPTPATLPDHLAYVIYTSGSTGRPKGVTITHRNASTFIFWSHEAFDRQDLQCVLASTSVCFDLSIFEIFVPLTCGGTVCLVGNILELAQQAPRQRISLINTVPSAIAEIRRLEAIPRTVRALNLAGEALAPSLVAALHESLPDIRIYNLYGPTEGTTYSTYTPLERGSHAITIGKPVANTRTYLLDEAFNPVPIGVAAELYIAGAGLARGYLKRPGLTAERFLPDPFGAPGARMYRTGDLARWLPEGTLGYLGRLDQQVKIRGFRIELGEIEAALAALPNIREAAVLAREDSPGEKRLVAYLVPRDDPALIDPAQLRNHLRESLPEYMVPSHVVLLDRLPLTPNGKLDRKTLPAPDLSASSQTYVAPRTPVERALANLWQEVLAVPQVGIHDNFFELGGHSLLAVKIISNAGELFQISLPLRVLFESLTLEQMAQAIAHATLDSTTAQPIECCARDAAPPLSFAQQRLWFLDRLLPNTSQYNIPGAVRLSGALDLDSLRHTLNEIVRRHEALRTTFTKLRGQPVQIIAPVLNLLLPVEDLSELPPGSRELQLQQQLHEQALRPFDLAQGPLIRARLLRLAEGEHVLALTLHHIVADGWSMAVLIREFVALYAAFLQGEPSPLPELPIQYADFAHWQRGWLSGAVLEEHLDYWREQLSGLPDLISLPTDRPRPPTITFNGATASFALPMHCLKALNALAQSHNATLFMALTAAFQLLLARYSGQDDICIGTPIANRNRAEIEPLIGCFVNTLVLRTRIDGHRSFGGLLDQVRTTALGAYAHQDLPFETLVDALNPQRNLNHTPLFQVMVSLQNLPFGAAIEVPGLTSQLLPQPALAAKFDLTLEMSETPDGLLGALNYNTDLFDPETIERLIGHFSRLLDAIIAHPERALAEVDMLQTQEREQLLTGFNRPIPSLPEDVELPQGLSWDQLTAVRVLTPDRQLSPVGAPGELYLADPTGQLFSTGVRARWSPEGEIEYLRAPTEVRNDAEPAVYVAPRTPSERALVELWQEILEVPQVGIHDNFFRIGGQSLLAVTVLSQIEARLGAALPVETFFRSPTIAELAEAVSNGTARQLTVPSNRIPPGCAAITPQMLPLITLSEHDIQRIAAHVPGGMPNIQDIYPLVALQEGVLFHHLMSQEGDPYLMPAQLAFDTRTRLDAFLQALQQVIQRHDVLRTAVLWQGLPTPLQVVWREAILPIEQIEMPPEVDVNAELASRFDPRHYRLDVRRAPLLHALIAQDSANSRWLLRLLFHHLAIDHLTIMRVLQEIRTLLEGHPEQLQTSLPFRDFVVRARRAVSQDEHDAFFRTLLADVTEPTAPFGLLDVRGDGGAVTEARLPVAPHIAHALRRQARRLGVSTASLMHLAWAQVLARTSGRNDVVFGTVLLGRMQVGEGAERVLGMFVNTLPIRLRLDAASVEQGVRNTHALLTELMHHEQAPLAHAQRCSGVAAPAPLFTALLNYRYSEIDPLQQQAWEGITLLSGEERTNYPITLSVDDLGEGFALTAQVREPLSPQRLCAYLHTALEHLVQALETRPDTPVMELDILSADEREQLLRAFNDTHRDFPLEQTIPQLFEAQVRRTPEALAVVHENRSLTYAQLNERANTLAHHLIACGVGPDVLVGLCLERSVDLVMALLAILKAGGAYVPLDPGYPSQRLAFMLQDSRPTLLLSHSALATQLPELDIPCLWLDTQAGLWDELPHTNPTPATLPDHLAYVIYTSGSTGRPKGIAMPNRGILNLLAWHGELQIDKPLAVQFAALGFDVAAQEILTTLCSSGGTLLLPSADVRLDPERFRGFLEATGAQLLFLPFVALQQVATVTAATDTRLPQLRHVITAGEQLRLDPAITALVARTCGGQLHNHYGPTETHVATTHVLPQDCKAWEALPPIGRPVANTRIYVLDVNAEPAPSGVAGELYIAGVQLARGYLNRPALTAERFLPDPFGAPGSRMYRTGDLARWRPEGTLEYLGRLDQQVKVRGFRIELGEIEAVLAALPNVREAAVLAREDRPGDKRLVAYLVCHDSESLALPALREALLQSLPEYMVPAHLVLLDRLPLTPNGKLDRKALPAPDITASSQAYVAPRNATERALANLWQEVLVVPQIGIHDNFFELGGHSLLATQLITKVGESFQISLPLRVLFDSPTLEQMAQAVARLTPGSIAVRRIERCARDAALPLSFAQQRLWFLDQLLPNTSQYNIPGAVRLSGTLDLNALSRTLNEIVRRHEALRTTFAKLQGQPVQIIAPGLNLLLSLEDLSELPPDTRVRQLQQHLQEEALRPFDLTQGPLIRTRLLRLAEHEHILAFTLHHIVSDGWSLAVLIREFVALYAAFLQGRPSPLPELPIQYADFAHWQRGWLSGAVLEQHLDYWREQLADAPELISLPTDRPRPPTITFNGATISFSLSAQCLKALNDLAQSHNATLFMALTAAFQLLLARYSGQNDICLGTPIANRNRAEIEPLIGCFVNTLVLRARINGDQSFEELLDQVRATALGAYAHQDLPFETLVDALNPQRRLNHAPLFQVMLVLQNLALVSAELPGLTSQPLPPPAIAAKFDLTLEMSETPEGLLGALNYNTDLFNPETIERLTGHFSHLLDAIVAHPSRALAETDMLQRHEREQLLTGFNRPIPSLPEGLELPQGLSWDQLAAVRVLGPDKQLSPVGALGELYLADPTGQLFSTGVRARWSPEGEIEYLRAPTDVRKDAEPVAYVSPGTPTERALVELWQEILDVPQVGIHDNFFRIGGQSLLAVTVLSQIEARLGTALPVETFFRSPTIAELSQVVDEQSPLARSSMDDNETSITRLVI